jgi:hypothetical protein
MTSIPRTGLPLFSQSKHITQIQSRGKNRLQYCSCSCQHCRSAKFLSPAPPSRESADCRTPKLARQLHFNCRRPERRVGNSWQIEDGVMAHIAADELRQAPAALRPSGHVFSLFNGLLWFQGAYFLVTGLWPLFSIETFQIVTGPKTDHLVTGRESDHWLVMTVGVLVTAVAVTLLVAAWRGRKPWEIVVLAVGSALALTAIDLIYVGRQVIDPIYLVDAVAELILISLWVVACLIERPA